MKAKFTIALVAAAMLLPMITSLFDLEARRRGGGGVIIVIDDPQTEISPN